MGDLDEKIAAGEPLLHQALQALRRCNEAKGVVPGEEVERLRIEAESLMIAVQEYQLRVLGGSVRPLHKFSGGELCSVGRTPGMGKNSSATQNDPHSPLGLQGL